MELDLNEEPLDQTPTSVTEFDSILNELESEHGHIEERIRHLEAVTYRARQRQRWRQGHGSIRINNTIPELTAPSAQNAGRMPQEEVGFAFQGRTIDNRKTGKRNSTHLIAKALGIETDRNKAESNTGNCFDCNICLDMARDPILTCCGHLFCWPCFYQVSYAYANVKECPVCKGEVTETGIIPIYGNSSVNSSCLFELNKTGLTVPPRPHACRIEGLRQQLISQGASSTIQEIRRLNNFIGAIGERVLSENPETTTDRTLFSVNPSRNSQPQPLSSMETENSQHNRSHQFSRLLVQGAASFSSLSSALNSAMDSAERLVEDLESYLHTHRTGRIRERSTLRVNRDSSFSTAATSTNQSESHTPDVGATNSAATSTVSPLGMNDDTTAVIDLEIQTPNSSVQISSTEPSSSSSRTNVSRPSDIGNGVSNRPRRRRLRLRSSMDHID